MQRADRPNRPRFSRRGPSALLANLLIVAVSASILVLVSGCAPSGDKCYVSPARHDAARRLYARSGSLQVVRETLTEADWLPCEVEQTIARLEKENGM